jgi:copper oxidase (laccase) domain-containing protein
MGNSQTHRKRSPPDLEEQLHRVPDPVSLDQVVQTAIQRHGEEVLKADKENDRSFEYSEVPEEGLPPGRERQS